ncbi:uncharacterized protein LOC129580996 isoform X2 [Paramacrobiotus metropolitanus]|uniref:uncharacterized protein LOC129580996 isoform X2 n=1 Tax=Paramacrobiotus metropolitanus TaxID=2943436 RepID=UPI0024460451|nr:uncharacterized protein LOC129580996 isoform X2 [Paramacrobiotus metropolitanus]
MAAFSPVSALIALSILCSMVNAQQFQFSRLWHPGKRAFDYSNPYFTSWSPFSGLAGGMRLLSVRQPDAAIRNADADYVMEDNGNFLYPEVATFSTEPVQTITQPVEAPVKLNPAHRF